MTELESQIKIYNKKRGICKAKLTNFTKFVRGLQDEILNLNYKVNPAKLAELETRLEIVVAQVLTEFEEYQQFLEQNHENQDEQLTERELFENNYYEIVGIAKSVLSRLVSLENPCGENISPSGSVVSSVVAPRAHPKLPSIPIPKFSGSYDRWLEFRDTFISLIHSNNEISDIEKFYFLRGALEGDAKEIVHSLEMSAMNYTVAWDLVCERFNNDTMLVNNHLKLLFDLPRVETESAVSVRKLVDGVTKHIRSLTTLGLPTDHWDVIVIFIIVGKLDSVTKRAWEEIKSKDKLPTLFEFKGFLRSRAETLEAVGDQTKQKGFSKRSFLTRNQNCSYCNKEHFITDCIEFIKLSVYQRYEHLKKLRLCLNCLKRNHFSKNCTLNGCKKCSSKHHVLLHYDTKKETTVQADKKEVTLPEDKSQSVTMSASQVGCSGEVLLSTVLVKLIGPQGNYAECRALLDNGSQSNLITIDLCKKLNLDLHSVDISLIGVNQARSVVNKKCHVKMQSLHNSFETKISCLVVTKISDPIPSHKLNISGLNIPGHLQLADPSFATPGPIDLILGVDIFYHLLCIGQIKLGDNLPLMQKTRLGWVIGGSMSSISYGNNSHVRCNFVATLDIQSQLTKFWSIEEPPSNKVHLSVEDQQCEDMFSKTTRRDDSGKFIVKIPLKTDPSELGDSQTYALNRFYALERKLAKNDKFSDMYKNFMIEYENIGHMSLDPDPHSSVSYFLPHHGVLNESSSTTKLRVVFNGSAPTDTGLSVNDIQYVGPSIQEDLLSILIRFRQNNIVVCADIEKMYRMVLIDQRCLQKIFWRDNPDKELNVYTLNTVTYGTRSAAYLAIRCLRQLGLENAEKFPEASHVILKDFYVDDMLTSFANVDKAITICSEVAEVLKSGCFNLRKWLSNEPQILQNLGYENVTEKVVFGEECENKTLGLYWSFQDDVLKYHISPNMFRKITKRTVLSDISKIYDPLSLLSPCIILAKILLQKIWSEKLEWDQSLHLNLNSTWISYRDNLIHLNDVHIPRQVTCKYSAKNQVHGFCDASIEAYGATVYLRSVNDRNEVTVRLMYSKAKVAPLKVITLPRLELCGALVLAQLVDNLKRSWDLNVTETFLWSDSTIVLSWLSTTPSILQTFVANRVAQIQSLKEIGDWNHVKSEHNPADLLSRGLQPEKIVDNKFWWNGPSWLSQSQDNWPESNFHVSSNVPEVKRNAISCHLNKNESLFPFSRFSKFSCIKRCLAYCRRFINNCRPGTSKVSGPLSVQELKEAVNILVIFSQQESYPHEKDLLESNGVVQRGPLARLNPFIAADGTLRVGGRIQLSDLDYEKKHPKVLSAQHPLANLIFTHEHIRLLHAGPQMLLASIREAYWDVRGRNLAKKVVHECIRCFRTRPKQAAQIMGILPEMRVRPMPPFNTCGIDFAGTFYVKNKQGRGAKLTKCYISLFVCFSTKALHLELVSDLTTEAFIAAFRRFASRRGCPAYVFSDNGTNFVGANIELKELGMFLQREQRSLVGTFENEGIVWKFIPAHSPNFGGLWEAGVKSCKYHLKRVMANASLTFEQFNTLLTQVEAILNSRPLGPISTDPNDLDVLTPAHFLIGRRLTSLPDPDLRDVKENKLN